MGKEIERARAFAAELAGVYGDQLVSAALYGSAARGEYREGVSDLNLLVLLKDASPAALRRGARLATKDCIIFSGACITLMRRNVFACWHSRRYRQLNKNNLFTKICPPRRGMRLVFPLSTSREQTG